MAENVGILAMELYVPFLYVDQSDLEVFCGESRGKYTIGLGQERMGFCSDLEDVQSLCLTAVSRLLTNYSIDPRQIGRLEVGTETIVDKSKSVKSVLMRLFEDCGNHDIEGVDAKNACFGGTQAIFNSVNWLESSYWDGRLALVVAADVAVYGEGPARCTGGAGSLAMLIGPNAPLVFEKGIRATYSKDVYDFYKPNLSSEFPVVDGALSVQCYLAALDHCYSLYREKVASKKGKQITLANFDGFVFHSPFSKLVQKALARLVYLDVLTNTELSYASISEVADFKKTNPTETYTDKNLEKAFINFSLPVFKAKTEPSLEVGKNVGNMYTPSVYAALISYLINTPFERLPGSTIGLFSYGSGLIASIFTIEVSKSQESIGALKNLVGKLSVKTALQLRRKVTPEEFAAAVNVRAQAHNKAPYVPVSSKEDLFDHVYYLTQIDEKHRRHYRQSSAKVNGLNHPN